MVIISAGALVLLYVAYLEFDYRRLDARLTEDEKNFKI